MVGGGAELCRVDPGLVAALGVLEVGGRLQMTLGPPMIGGPVMADNPPSIPAPPVTWSRWRECPAVIVHPPHLRRTVTIALTVGLLLFLINQLDVVIQGRAGPLTVVKACLNVLIPFCVSNLGVLTATRKGSA